MAASEQPNNPTLRFLLGRAMLQTGQIEAGLAELERAMELDKVLNSTAVSDMVRKAKAELLICCHHCRAINRREALICRRCCYAIVKDKYIRLLAATVRPIFPLVKKYSSRHAANAVAFATAEHLEEVKKPVEMSRR